MDPAAGERLREQFVVLRAAGGDEAAFVEIVEKYEPRLRYYLRKLLADRHAADDALQDVWLDVLRKLATLRDPAAFTAWLYRLARDHALRRLRRREPHASDAIEIESLADVVEEEFTAADADAVHAALDQLRPEHRDALLLRFIEQMSYADIATVTGCNVGTVRSRIHYAKQSLGKIIELENASCPTPHSARL